MIFRKTVMPFGVSKTGKAGALIFCLLLAYTAWWAVWYRIPASPKRTVDLRQNQLQPARYISFCAGLASNPVGFPGHAYVNWSGEADTLPGPSGSIGYIPQKFNDQVVSVFTTVPGMLHQNALMYNQRNLDSLTVVVSPETYNHTLIVRDRWNTGSFKAGSHDCVSFVLYIAQEAGLVVPKDRCFYPQDQIKVLKELNRNQHFIK